MLTGRSDGSPARQASVRAFLLFVLLALAMSTLHAAQFAGRQYRQDEAWVVHAALENLERESLPVLLVRNLTQFAAENATLEVWIALFGHAEPVTRWLSALWSALTLAALYRLAADLFDRRAALLAVLLLGVSGFFASHAHETRPYALLIFGTVALQLVFLRWVRRPRPVYALAYGLLAVFTFYAHLFVVYVFAAQAISFVLLVRWNRRRTVQAFALFAAVGVAILPRLLAALHFYLSIFPGGIWYAVPTGQEGYLQLYRELQYGFEPLALLLQLAGLILPAALAIPALRREALDPPTGSMWRFDPGWRKGYAVLVPLLIVIVGLLVNAWVRNVTARNLVIILPSVALIMALGLRAIRPRVVQALAVLLMLPAAFSATTVFSPNVVAANHPVLEQDGVAAFMAPDFRPGDRVVIEMPFIVQHVPLVYYVRERLSVRVPKTDLFQIMRPTQAAAYIESNEGGIPSRPVNLGTDVEPETLARFETFLDGAGDQLWYVGTEDGVFGTPAFRRAIERRYDVSRQSGAFWLYRRRNTAVVGAARFGDHLVLRSWSLEGDGEAEPCGGVTLDMQWQADETVPVGNGPALWLAGGDTVHAAAPPAELPSRWQANTVYPDRRTLAVPCGLEPGDYELWLSFADSRGGWLPVTLPDGSSAGAHFVVTRVAVR